MTLYERLGGGFFAGIIIVGLGIGAMLLSFTYMGLVFVLGDALQIGKAGILVAFVAMSATALAVSIVGATVWNRIRPPSR